MTSLDLVLKDSFAVPAVPKGDACHQRFPARLDSSRRFSSQSNAITAHRRAGPHQEQFTAQSLRRKQSPLPWRGAESSTSSDSDVEENTNIISPSLNRSQDKVYRLNVSRSHREITLRLPSPQNKTDTRCIPCTSSFPTAHSLSVLDLPNEISKLLNSRPPTCP